MEENNAASTPSPVSGSVYSRKAIAGFVCSLVGFLCCFPAAIVGLVLSIVGLNEINHDSQYSGKGLCIAGIILGALAIIWQVLVWSLYAAGTFAEMAL